ncbi:hypothetical protein BH20CHL6_BH20CHL6_02450 [soil metagenome]
MTLLGYDSSMTPAERETSLANLKLERDAVVLYDRLSQIEKEPHRAAAFRTIAGNERRHAEIWARRLSEAGADVPEPGGARLRVRLIIGLARAFGTRAVSDLVQALEGDEEDAYAAQAAPEVAGIAADEREHAEIWKRLDAGTSIGNDAVTAIGNGAREQRSRRAASHPGASHSGASPSRVSHSAASAAAPSVAPAAIPAGVPPVGAAPVSAAAATTGPASDTADEISTVRRTADSLRTEHGREESWHRRSGRSGTLRAAIFGVNDGLVSNLGLVMGVTGAAADNHIIVLAGVAGLLAGASSMGAGEWISMQSQRELFERQIEIEREELRIMPEVEEQELAGIYRSKGLPVQEADRLARRLMADPEVALDTMVREELGLDPDELGSPWGAAGGSFVAFSVGALIPLVPFLLASGAPAIIASLAVAGTALFAVGAGVSLLTGRSALFSGLRQVAIGAGAAAITFAAGVLIGVQVAG